MAADVPSYSMSPGAIAHFLWFQQGEWLPIILVSLMAISAFGVLAWTSANANEKNWKTKWEDLKSDDYGSIADISEAIAHPSERWCSILPSLLLVAGLLGTFIGLGISLDAASQVFENANSSSAEIEQVLIGLGAKFKTSTWGIIFFLFVRITSKLKDWESQRLNFCITNITRQRTTSRINDRRFMERLTTAVKEQIQHSERSSIPFLKKISEGIEHFVSANEQNMGKIRASASEMAAAAQLMKSSAETMSSASNALEGAANGLSGEIQAFGNKVDETLGGIKSDLGAAIEGMSNTIGRQMDQMAGSMKSSTDEIEITMNKLQNSVGETMKEMSQDIKTSIEDQSHAVAQTQEAVSALLLAATRLSEPVNRLSREVKENVTRMQRDALVIQDLANISLESGEKLKDFMKTEADQLARLTGALQSAISRDDRIASDVHRISQQVTELQKLAARLANLSRTEQVILSHGDESET
ncbi:hypothetical protein [Erythrobacter sp. CCH5-A1]|uniref:hypothetical protein n=1 Tax=Erythrobacter sp. CCH5-A1 TaxID=1768792 RepID=UPI00082A2A4C|nr:hypothetical protein [Erythrobacter sp. CCH5-A1]